MIHGPCGGVTANGLCEAAPEPCPFVDDVVLSTPGNTEHRPRPTGLGTTLIDLVLPDDDAELAAIADIYRTTGSTALVGEHLDDPRPHVPHIHAERLAAVGQPAVVTLTGRYRSVGEHDAEIAALVATGVVAVHCVTGDHPAARFGPDATAPFTLDGTGLAGRARDAGAIVSTGESPTAPPVADRPARVVAKERAGADIVVLNHAGPTERLVAFADRCADAGAQLTLVAPVPVVTDEHSARALDQFPGLVLPDGLVDRVMASSDPRRTGVEAAVTMGRALLDSGRFAALNLSGSEQGLTAVERAELMASVAEAIG